MLISFRLFSIDFGQLRMDSRLIPKIYEFSGILTLSLEVNNLNENSNIEIYVGFQKATSRPKETSFKENFSFLISKSMLFYFLPSHEI